MIVVVLSFYQLFNLPVKNLNLPIITRKIGENDKTLCNSVYYNIVHVVGGTNVGGRE